MCDMTLDLAYVWHCAGSALRPLALGVPSPLELWIQECVDVVTGCPFSPDVACGLFSRSTCNGDEWSKEQEEAYLDLLAARFEEVLGQGPATGTSDASTSSASSSSSSGSDGAPPGPGKCHQRAAYKQSTSMGKERTLRHKQVVPATAARPTPPVDGDLEAGAPAAAGAAAPAVPPLLQTFLVLVLTSLPTRFILHQLL